MRIELLRRLIPAIFPILWAGSLFAQQVTVGTPFNSLGDSYYENYGLGWNLNWHSGYAQFGMPNPQYHHYGGNLHTGGVQTGWHFGTQNFHGNAFFHADQGFRRNFIGQTPWITLLNGQTGGIYDMSLSPFITGHTPYMVGYPVFARPTQDMWMSVQPDLSNSLDRVQAMRRLLARQKSGEPPVSMEPDPAEAMLPRTPATVKAAAPPSSAPSRSNADRPVPSVAEAKRLYELEKAAEEEEVLALFERAKNAEAEGKPNLAKIYYQMIVKRTQGDLKEAAEQKLKK